MQDTKFDCVGHGWRSHYQVCPFCTIAVLQDDLSKEKAKREKAEAEMIDAVNGPRCGDCDDTGLLEDRVEGKYPCTCITETDYWQWNEERLLSAKREGMEERKVVLEFNEESKAFEAFAMAHGYDMSQHPLHYLFLDKLTHVARTAWNGALSYVARSLNEEV